MYTFKKAISTMMVNGQPLTNYIKEHKTDRTFTYMGRSIVFIGADQEQKLRGNECDILYCNEANELSYLKEFFQLNVRCKYVSFIDFNPSDPYTWINEDLEQKRMVTKGDVEVIHSTYIDNLEHLTEEQISEIEYLEESAPDLWAVYGLGEYGLVEGLIFPTIHIIDEMPTELRRRGYGQDLGYSIDPTTILNCGTIGNNLYVDEIFYQRGLLKDDILDKYRDHYISKTRRINSDYGNRMIDEIGNEGYNIHQAIKMPIIEGISILKQYKIHVTARSAGLIKEQKLYKYKVNKSGDIVTNAKGHPVPIDKWNHGWDALRYYGEYHLKSIVKRRGARAGSV